MSPEEFQALEANERRLWADVSALNQERENMVRAMDEKIYAANTLWHPVFNQLQRERMRRELREEKAQ